LSRLLGATVTGSSHQSFWGCSYIGFLNFATGKVRTVAPLTGAPLSVWPDGHFILYMQFDEAGSDLMLVENFR
jgi:hypothetical protein